MHTNTARLSATRKITMLGVLSAIAYVAMVVGRFPLTSVEFLKYDPKDVIITFAGFLYGPLSALAVSLVVSLVEMFTVSTTGPIGLVMNVLSTAAFACTAAAIYKKRQTLRRAVLGLVVGALMMTVAMLLWNYLITPLYMALPREQVAGMLLPVFLPFNLLKSGLNATLTFLLYKPLVRALRGAGLLSTRELQGPAESQSQTIHIGYMLLAGVVLASCVLAVLVMRGII